MYIGKTNGGEIDFVADRRSDRLYIQVTQEILAENTQKRENERLLSIGDNYPKYVLRTDTFTKTNDRGIAAMHIADFLLSDKY